MTEEEWLACADPYWLAAVLARADLGSERKLRRCAVEVCRWLLEQRPRTELKDAIPYAERVLEGKRAERPRALSFLACADDAGSPLDMKIAKALYHVSSDTLIGNRLSTAFGCVVLALSAFRVFKNGESNAAGPVSDLARWARVFHDIFGNPFRPVAFSPEWRTDTAVTLARTMYESREFSAMPILADALQDAGCDSAEALDHCRGPGPHVRGCWVCDLVLSKE